MRIFWEKNCFELGLYSNQSVMFFIFAVMIFFMTSVLVVSE